MANEYDEIQGKTNAKQKSVPPRVWNNLPEPRIGVVWFNDGTKEFGPPDVPPSETYVPEAALNEAVRKARAEAFEEAAGVPETFRVEHINLSSVAAGKNYSLFLRFLYEFTKSGATTGEIIFTCPEVKELESLLKAEQEKCKRLECFIEELPKLVDEKLQSIMAGNYSVLVDSYRRQIAEVFEKAAREEGEE